MAPQLDYFPRTPWRDRVPAGLLILLNVITSKLAKRWAIRLVCTICVLAITGFVSNHLSKTTCEQRTAHWLANVSLGGGPFCALPDNAAESLSILQAAGIQPAQVSATSHPVFPWVDIHHAHSVAPFIVEVDYGWCYEPQMGEGGSYRFLCLFGHVIEIGNRIRWIS